MSEVIVRIPADQAGKVAEFLRDQAYLHAKQPMRDTLMLMAVQIRNTLTDWNLPHD